MTTEIAQRAEDDSVGRAVWAQAIAACQQSIEEHLLIKHRQAHNYKYVGHADVLSATSRLAAHNIVIGAPRETAMASREYGPADKSRCVWEWTFEIPVYEITTGHVEVFRIAATTMPGDKAAFVASTAADRTLRLRLFGLGGGEMEDPEHPNNSDAPSGAGGI